jgi:hypothetical protein
MDTLQALTLFFACLILGGSAVSYSAENTGNALQPRQPPNIELTLSEQAPAAIRLEARHAPLGQILKEIARKTGARIHYTVLPQEPVTASCKGPTVSHLLECLLGSRIDRVYRYPRSGAIEINAASLSTTNPLNTFARDPSGQPEEIWLLASDLPIKPGITGNDLLPTQEPKTSAAQPEPTPEEQAQLEATLKQASSKNTDERSTALYNLGLIGHKDDPTIRKTLEEALADKDANVRTQAITSLIQREGKDAAPEVQQALKDKDVNVRMAVISNVHKDTAILQQALADSDKMIRDLAASKLTGLASRQNP